MRLAIAIAVLLMAGCERDRAEVQCQGNEQGAVVCSVKHTTGTGSINACFDAVISCKSGSTSSAHACQKLAPEQLASKTLTDDDFKGLANCTPNGFTVANLVITNE